MHTVVQPERICIYHVENGRSQGCVEADLIPECNSFWVSRVMVQKRARNAGLGTRLMEELCRVLDERQLNAHLVPNPYDETITFDRLSAFYQRFGFTWNLSFMKRVPTRCADAASRVSGSAVSAAQIAV